MITLQPLRDYVLVKKMEREEKSSAGLILNSFEQKNILKACVLGVGDGVSQNKTSQATTLVEGDVVYFEPSKGIKIYPEFLLLKEEEIVAKD